MIYFGYSPFFSFTIEHYSLSVVYSMQSCHTYQSLIKYPLWVPLSFLHSSPTHPRLLFAFIPTSSFPLPLHPDCMCMNIDVNYSSSQNCCSICDFPAEFAHNIPTLSLTHTHQQKENIMKTSVCCAPQQELKPGEWSLWNCIFSSLRILPSKSYFSIQQIIHASMRRYIKCILNSQLSSWITAD